VNTCFQPFESSNKSRFVFYRTDPLYLSQVVNFDVALFSPDYNMICLIECKSSLRTRLESTVNEFQKKIDFVEKNNWVNVGRKRIRRGMALPLMRAVVLTKLFRYQIIPLICGRSNGFSEEK